MASERTARIRGTSLTRAIGSSSTVDTLGVTLEFPPSSVGDIDTPTHSRELAQYSPMSIGSLRRGMREWSAAYEQVVVTLSESRKDYAALGDTTVRLVFTCLRIATVIRIFAGVNDADVNPYTEPPATVKESPAKYPRETMLWLGKVMEEALALLMKIGNSATAPTGPTEGAEPSMGSFSLSDILDEVNASLDNPRQ